MIPKTVWRTLYALNWIVIGLFWWQGSGSELLLSPASATIAIGRLCGLIAAYMVLLQFFFMGRTPLLERVFGLDTLSRIHHNNGRYSLLFLLLHPILLSAGYASLLKISFAKQSSSFLFNGGPTVPAAIGLLCFIIVGFSSFYIARKKLRYESWYFIHLLAYVAVFFSFFHQFALGSDLLSSKLFYGYWAALYVLVFVSHLLFRFARPLYLYIRHQFYISRVERENHTSVSLYISGKHLESFRIEPGQFMILRFLTKQFWWQAHPFSLSMVPNGNEIRVTIKELGDFTKQVAAIPVGTKLIIDGPYGVFTEHASTTSKSLFIAGGIGITPIRSLMEEMLQHKKDVIMLYANKSEKEIVLKKEIDALSTQYNANIIHILSDEPGYKGETGRLDEEKIKRLVPDFAMRDVYVCGPPLMMEALIKTLKKLGVPAKQLHYEQFSMG